MITAIIALALVFHVFLVILILKHAPQERRPNQPPRTRSERMEERMSLTTKLSNLLFGTRAASPAPPEQSAPKAPAVRVDYNDPRVPGPAKDRVQRILACMEEVGRAMDREGVPGFSRSDMIQMREQHLPKLVKSYIDIPEAHRPEIFRKTGKSASFILNESLDQMQARLDEILRNLAQHDIDAFSHNARFVGQRYSQTENPFS